MSTMPPKPEPTAERFMPPGCRPNYDLFVTTTPPFAEATAEMFMPPECRPNYDLIVTEDHQPVDSLYGEILMRLLTSVLYDSWPGPGAGRTFLATANVGLFYSFNTPPVVPDVMLSLDVALGDPKIKKNRSYFLWEHGKAPEATLEIVSGTDGGELGKKLDIYENIGVSYYIVWDPDLFLSAKPLHCFIRQGRKFAENGTWFPQIGLGVAVWQGVVDGWTATWLRWCDEQGVVLPTGVEKNAQEKQRAEQEKQRAEQEKQRAEQEKQRADKLAEKLRAMGIDPDQP